MTDPNFYIATPRLYISYFQPDNSTHCNFLVELYNTPEFIASIGGRPTTITNPEAARERLEGRFRAEHVRNGYGTYLVSLKGKETSAPFADAIAEATPVGTVSLMRGEGPTAFTVPDLGFAMLPAHMRKGYAKESVEGLLAYAKTNLGVDAVLGLFDPHNRASNAVFRSLGFEDRGIMTLKAFGGILGAVWVLPGMAQDLSVYGI